MLPVHIAARNSPMFYGVSMLARPLSPLLLALWHDAKGDWDGAHRVAQDVDGENAAWVHAYLHRKEGDASNADYWYRRARRLHSRHRGR